MGDAKISRHYNCGVHRWLNSLPKKRQPRAAILNDTLVVALTYETEMPGRRYSNALIQVDIDIMFINENLVRSTKLSAAVIMPDMRQK